GADRHNRTIVAATYDEAGVLGKIAAKAPAVQSLESPSAPEPNFLEVDLSHLTHLAVDAGYATHNFIRNLAQARFPPLLRGLEWGEYAEHYMTDWRAQTTPLEDMRALLSRDAFAQIQYFTLRNPIYSND